jgi:hypothetical protein
MACFNGCCAVWSPPATDESPRNRRCAAEREEFLNELRTAVQSAAWSYPNRTGRVLVTMVTDARGLPHKHVLSSPVEGYSAQPEDPLYLDTERQRLAAAGMLWKPRPNAPPTMAV